MRNFLPDLLFMICAALLAWLAAAGSVEISAGGALMDSDLETYAQAMAGENAREMFGADPALANANPANSIPNMERLLGGALAPEGEWGTGLLRAGGFAIFLFYAGWYLLGRWLYKTPVMAALLALCCGVTIWVGWGTFWGVLHSDPIPRVFFAAALPFLLLLFFQGLTRPILRPAAMLATGLTIWIHGVSALNCGAMFFMAYMLCRPDRFNLAAHLGNLAVTLAAFMAPALIFLWPSLIQGKNFDAAEIGVFQQLFALRWQADYSNFGGRLIRFFSPGSAALPIMAGGILGWLVIWRKGDKHEKLLARACPAFLIGLLLVTAFCWLEGRLAPEFGRLPMGHELVRGLRFLVPIGWMLALGGIALLVGATIQRLIFCAVLVCVLWFPADRQYMAAQYAFSQLTGIDLPLTGAGAEEARDAAKTREFFEDLAKIVPPGEAVYCPQDAMQVRYISLRPLAHSFKDGYIHFYNKNPEASARWLKLEELAHDGPEGWLKAWQASGAPWLLLPPKFPHPDLSGYGEIVLRKNGWLLLRK